MAESRVFRNVISELSRAAGSRSSFTRFDVFPQSMTARVAILGSCVAIKVIRDGTGSYFVGATGIGPVAVRWLHDVLIVHSKLVLGPDGRELQVLRSGVTENELVDAIRWSAAFLYKLRAQEEGADYCQDSTVSMYWSSGVLNFGDWSGPHIVHIMTGRQPVQSNRPSTGGRVLYTVGSILGWIKRNNVDVWGSGLIKPLSSEEARERSKLSGVRIHAVRGQLTKRNLEDSLDWNVPEVFGDPALLIPDFVSRGRESSGGITVVPHHIHRSMCDKNSSISTLVDVRRDVHDVCRAISEGSVVISTSLHGIIIAQAFKVPWVWLRVDDKPLIGDDFKFEDFFSCLDRDAVSIVRIKAERLESVDYESIAAEAKLPDLTISLDLLRDSLPVKPAGRPMSIVNDQK